MIRFLFCGDFVSQNPHKLKLGHKLKSLIQAQDFVAVNFEAPLKGFGNATKKSGPVLSQSIDSPSFLIENGINIILLANNHMMDNGVEACKGTIEIFKKNNVYITGAGDFPNVFDILILKKDNLKIGLLNLTHKEFGTLTIDADSGDYGTAWINHPLVNQKILSSKDVCDYLVVLPHAGIEDVIVPLPEWRARYKEFIDFGADIVIGSHPHTPQGWEEYKGKKIYYSLGNFFFELFSTSHGPNWFKSILIECSIDEKKGLSSKVYNCLFDKDIIEIDNSKGAVDYNKYLCGLLQNRRNYYTYLDNELTKLWREYKLYLLRGLSAFTFRCDPHVFLHAAYGIIKGNDVPLLINNFQCESHCWAIERMLNLQHKGNE